MIDFYTWTTPNGRKVSILLEELAIPYRTITVNLQDGEQQQPEFLAINPNSKIPAIVDHDVAVHDVAVHDVAVHDVAVHDVAGGPVSVFESGAILIYLAEKHGRFLSTTPAVRAETLQWLMFQMSGIGPFLGQVNYWMNNAPEKIPQAIQRYLDESVRLMQVFNGALAGRDFIAGEYSIADMAAYPWVAAAWGPFTALLPDKVKAMPNVTAWIDRMGAREAVVRGMAVPKLG